MEELGKGLLVIVLAVAGLWAMIAMIGEAIEKIGEAVKWARENIPPQVKMILWPIVSVVAVFVLLMNIGRRMQADEALEVSLLAGALLFVMLAVTEWLKR